MIRSDPHPLLNTFLAIRPRLGQLILRRVGSWHIAEELLQDTFLRLWVRRDRLEGRDLRGYLVTTGRNLSTDHLRRARLMGLIGDLVAPDLIIDPAPGPEETLALRQNLHRLAGAISDLPPQVRRVFFLIRIEELSYIAVADLLGISKKTVGSHMANAMLRLHREMMQA